MQKQVRIEWIGNFVDVHSRYENMYHTVHINKKWFYLHHDGAKVYLAEDKDNAVGFVKHKSHITKVMMLAAVAWPWYLSNGALFDSKIGIWPLAEESPALRSSKNRKRGTMECKQFHATREQT